MLNLLSNAAKYTQKGTISISVKLNELNVIKISISDTGCGLS